MIVIKCQNASLHLLALLLCTVAFMLPFSASTQDMEVDGDLQILGNLIVNGLDSSAQMTDIQLMASLNQVVMTVDTSRLNQKLRLSTLHTLLANGSSPANLLAMGFSTEDLLGLEYQGGLIFYVAEDGSGLVTAPDFVEFEGQWGCRGNYQHALGGEIGDGLQNTQELVTNCGTGDVSPVDAAKKCFELELAEFQWYLPNVAELQELYMMSKNLRLGFFDEGKLYWTSSNATANAAMAFSFASGSTELKNKTTNGRIKPIHQF